MLTGKRIGHPGSHWPALALSVSGALNASRRDDDTSATESERKRTARVMVISRACLLPVHSIGTFLLLFIEDHSRDSRTHVTSRCRVFAFLFLSSQLLKFHDRINDRATRISWPSVPWRVESGANLKRTK